MGRGLFVCVALVTLAACGSSGGGYVPSSDATLANLTLSSGMLSPAFDPSTTSYTVGPGLLDAQVRITPTASHAGATCTVGGFPVASGASSVPLTLPWNVASPIDVVVTAEDGTTQITTQIAFHRAGLSALEAYIKSANSEADDGFGINAAISGDTLVVGATWEDSAASGVNGNQADNTKTEAGAAYVFVRNGTTWTQQAYLKSSHPDTYDQFGRSVAVSGDTIAVGAWREDSTATGVNGDASDNSDANSGAVFVFVRNGTTWTQQAYIKPSNTDPGDWFGDDLALDGNTLVVGSAREDSIATGVNGNDADNTWTNSGAAYVFVRNGTTWTQQAYLKASASSGSDEFGYSVDVSGDTIVVGAYLEDSDASGVNGDDANDNRDGSGAAYVFVRNGTTWTQQAYLKASNPDVDDNFGYDVAVSGDTVAVGAIWEDSNAVGIGGNEADDSAANSGAVYVFTRSGTTWSQQAYVKASNTGIGDDFGFHLGLDGDTLLVGAFNEDSNASGLNGNEANDGLSVAGAAYVFTRFGSAWTQRTYLKATNPDANDRFGYRVALDGDTVIGTSYLEDSNATVIGGNQSNNAASDSGAVYVYR